MKSIRVSFFTLLVCFSFLAQSCSSGSYPADNLKKALSELCQKEYGIDNIDVKIKGRTIGVFLPLSKLFAADFRETTISGKVRNLDTLFEPSPEALDKVEDVLFGISRVLLSTEKELDFYVLQATDVQKSGMQLVLTGYVDDIRRVRIWDIPRSEYRKRVVHELRLNRAVRWHQPVRAFFEDISQMTVDKIRDKYFSDILPVEAIQTIFAGHLNSGDPGEVATHWNITDIRSTPLPNNEVLVYSKATPYKLNQQGIEELQFLFTLAYEADLVKIRRIIPFQYRQEDGVLKKIPFPKELQIDDNLDKWEQEFPLESLEVGPFLANQLTRRVQALIGEDERIRNTFRNAKMMFFYVNEGESSHFDMQIEATLADFNNYKKDSLVFHEDMLYLLKLASREFVDVMRSYRFGDYDYLSLSLAQEATPFLLGRDDLERFRRKKMDLQGLLIR